MSDVWIRPDQEYDVSIGPTDWTDVNEPKCIDGSAGTDADVTIAQAGDPFAEMRMFYGTVGSPTAKFLSKAWLKTSSVCNCEGGNLVWELSYLPQGGDPENFGHWIIIAGGTPSIFDIDGEYVINVAGVWIDAFRFRVHNSCVYIPCLPFGNPITCHLFDVKGWEIAPPGNPWHIHRNNARRRAS